MLSGVAAPASMTDSVALMNAVARAVAVSLQDATLRTEFFTAFRRSTAREHKLHVQRFFAAAGIQALRKIEERNGLPAGGLRLALSRLPDLEMYLPVKAHRLGWTGDSTVLVTAMLDSDSELKKAGKTFPAFAIDGSEHRLSAGSPPTQPVIVLIPRESGANGESQEVAGPMATECDPITSITPCEGEGGGPPPDPCAPGTGVYAGVCRVNIGYIDQYEGWPRGTPETTIQMFAVNPDGTGYQQLSCLNEDRGGVEYYDQDTDNWEGNATVADSMEVLAAVASGKKVAMVLWEDDTGSKCGFTSNSSDIRQVIKWLGYGGNLACVVAGAGGDDPHWLLLAYCVLGDIVAWFMTTDDDLIGAASQPAVPGTAWVIRRKLETGSTINAGSIEFRSQGQ